MKTALAILLLSASVVMGAPALPQRGLVQEFDTIAEALASNPSQLTDTYVIKGLNAINDGLAGKFYFLAGDTSDTNSTDCFAWSTGRLKRTFDGVTASQVLVFGSSTNKAGDLTIETNGYMRLLYVVPTLGSGGTAAVFDSTGMLTNGTGGTFVSTNGIFTNITVLNAIFLQGTNVAALNPTDLYIPVRVGTNGFADSPLRIPAEGNTSSVYMYGFGTGSVDYSRMLLGHTGTNGALVMDSQGAGTAGAARPFVWQSNSVPMMTLSGSSGSKTLAVTNAAAGGLASMSIDSSGGTAQFVGGSSGALFTIADGSIGFLLSSNNRIKAQGVNGNTDFGYYGGIWNKIMGKELHVFGYDGTTGSDYSRLAISQSNSNAPIVFNSQASGSGGTPQSFNFNFGGTNFYVMRQVSGNPYFDLVNPITSSQGSITEASGQIIMSDSSAAGLTAGTSTLTVNSSGVAALYRGANTTEMDIYGFLSGGGSHSRLSISHLGTNSSIFFNSISDGTAGTVSRPFVFTNAPVYIHKNIGAFLNVGDTAFVDLSRASQTNVVSGAMTFAHATNGVDGFDLTHVRWLFNNSGSDQTLTIPAGWKTNVYSAVPPALTNATITVMYVKCGGPTSSSTLQTNCYVSFEYYK